jgi:hypothetical protein
MGNTKKYNIVIEQVRKEIHEFSLEEASVMEALDKARHLVTVRNTRCPIGTYYSVKKIEEIKDE